MFHAALSAKVELHAIAANADVAIAERGQAIRVVLFGVFPVSHANECRFQQTYDGGQHFVSRELLSAEIPRDASPKFRQSFPEDSHAMVLGFIACQPPVGVIAVLLSSPGITSNRLKMAFRRWAYPHVGPRRRNCEALNSLERRLAVDDVSVRVEIPKGLLCTDAPVAARFVGDVG